MIGDTDVTAASPRQRTAIRRRQLGFVFQQSNLFEALTATDQLLYQASLAGLDRMRAAQAAELLAAVGMSDKADRRPGQLSGGERQRVGIARSCPHQQPHAHPGRRTHLCARCRTCPRDRAPPPATRATSATSRPSWSPMTPASSRKPTASSSSVTARSSTIADLAPAPSRPIPRRACASSSECLRTGGSPFRSSSRSHRRGQPTHSEPSGGLLSRALRTSSQTAVWAVWVSDLRTGGARKVLPAKHSGGLSLLIPQSIWRRTISF